MEENKVTVDELVSQLISDLRRAGYTETTIWRDQTRRIGYVTSYYRQKGQIFYDPNVTDEFVQLQTERLAAGEISEKTFIQYKKSARWMNSYYLTGELRVCTHKVGTRYLLSPANEALVSRFVAARNYGDNTSDDVVWAVRRYLYHFEKLGHESMATVSIEEAREYILKSASEMKVASLHNILLYLKYFHRFLKEQGIPAPDCEKLMSNKVYRDMPIQSYVTDEELERILAVIDTTTEVGKRNRAIILLGATTGLRAIDIIRLKLTDIDWRKGEISIVQAKTGNTTRVPLLRETGEAIQDYILNARPTQTGCSEVFLRALAPKTAIMDTTCIGCMFRSYQDAAGIRRQSFDGKGFHGLRRRLAKKMIVSGTPITTIAQVLGHTDPDSARQYLSLNTDNLKECALDLSGIRVERRELL